MSDRKVEFVDRQETLSSKVGWFLISKGFDLASSDGEALGSMVETCAFGILYKRPGAKPKRYLFGLITRVPRRIFLGVVQFGNSVCGANEQGWIFEVYGRKHVELAMQLAEEMAAVFNTKIVVQLESEQQRVEKISCYSDYTPSG